MHGNFTKCTGVFDWFDKEEQVINAYKKFDNIVCVPEFAKDKI